MTLSRIGLLSAFGRIGILSPFENLWLYITRTSAPSELEVHSMLYKTHGSSGLCATFERGAGMESHMASMYFTSLGRTPYNDLAGSLKRS